VRRLLLTLPLLLLVACSSTEDRLVGRWETIETPKRTLDLRKDHTFARRLSGKTLGFLSDLVGPQSGSWSVVDDTLVLATRDDKGVASSERLPVAALEEKSVTLGEDHWVRLTQQ
jgi:hypothetical protein